MDEVSHVKSDVKKLREEQVNLYSYFYIIIFHDSCTYTWYYIHKANYQIYCFWFFSK